MQVILKYFNDFTAMQLKQFSMLESLYKEWNDKINVISRKDIDHLYERHVLHSLSIAAIFNFQPGMEVIDIGSGGGFPSVPLAILFPGTNFHAVDSINKKLTVVKEITSAADIHNISTRHIRAGDIKDQKFDVAISRAVAPLKDLLFWCKPILNKANPAKWGAKDGELLVPSGLICLKGGDLANEIHESGSKPKMWEINQLFNEPFFLEKYILQAN